MGSYYYELLHKNNYLSFLLITSSVINFFFRGEGGYSPDFPCGINKAARTFCELFQRRDYVYNSGIQHIY